MGQDPGACLAVVPKHTKYYMTAQQHVSPEEMRDLQVPRKLHSKKRKRLTLLIKTEILLKKLIPKAVLGTSVTWYSGGKGLGNLCRLHTATALWSCLQVNCSGLLLSVSQNGLGTCLLHTRKANCCQVIFHVNGLLNGGPL